MCGRFTLIHGVRELRERFGVHSGPTELPPRYNIAPGQMASVVVVEEDRRVLKPMKWGLVPVWADDPKIGNRMINVRGETVAEKPAFKRSLKRRRCLVLADGFYEWRAIAGRKGKFPMRIVLRGEPPFAFAGLWDKWKSPEGEELETFTIITTGANELIEPIHERMPVILSKEDEAAWLDPSREDPEMLKTFLKSYPSEAMEMYDVTRAVNNAMNDSPACVERAGEEAEER